MKTFYNVQRGQFVPRELFPKTLTGCSGAVKLDHMSVPFFDADTIAKAYRRIMYEFAYYDVYSTGIMTPAGKELKIFARKDRAYDTIAEVKKFIEKPWRLADHVYLSCVKNATDNFPTNFWWAVDLPKEGMLSDWMAFLDTYELEFKAAISGDYFNWWLEIPCESRRLAYFEALE